MEKNIEDLVIEWRDEFYLENNACYSKENYKSAERKFILYKIKEYWKEKDKKIYKDGNEGND